MPFSDFWIENPAAWGVAGFLFFWALETWLPFVADRRERVVHAGRNVALTLMNAALIALVFVAAMAWMAGWADSNGMGLLHAFSAPAWAKSLLALLLMDAWIYGWHRLSHVVPILWRLHRVHHTDPAMDVSSATRFHSAEIFISSVLRLALIPLLGLSFGHLLLYDMLQLPVTQFHHSNLRLPEKVDRIVRALIVSPNMHRVHHSRLQVETDSNFSSIFSVWDRLAGTFRLRTHPETIEFGLDGFDAAERQTVWGMLGTPFLASSRESSPPQKKRKFSPLAQRRVTQVGEQ